MSKDVKENTQISALKDDLSKHAQKLILERFPAKIIELNNILESDLLNMKDIGDLHASLDASSSLWNGQVDDLKPPTKKRKLTGTDSSSDTDTTTTTTTTSGAAVTRQQVSISCNSRLLKVIDVVKPEIIEVVDRCNKLKMWVQLMIPKIEDGNNFGVGIQEDVLGEVSKAESDAGSYLEQVSRYFTCRGKMVSKVAKYPELADYKRGVREYDEKVFFSFRLILQEIRNIYIVLYDVIIKNFEKLLRPRNSNTSSLY